MGIQALISPALAVLHNFIQHFDPEDIHMYDDDQLDDLDLGFAPKSAGTGELRTGVVMPCETAQANERQDQIAGKMWEQYQHYHASHRI
jgi:hypothetical protein